MSSKGRTSPGVGRLLRTAIAVGVGVAPLLLSGSAGAASVTALTTSQGAVRASSPTASWGTPLTPARRVSVTAGQQVRTNQLPATLRTAPVPQMPRPVRDPAAYATAKARQTTPGGTAKPGAGVAGVNGGAMPLPAIAPSPAVLGAPLTAAFFDSEPGDWVGQGTPWTFSSVAFTGLRSGYPTFHLGTGLAGTFDAWFAAPAGQPLVPGVYEDAQRFDFRAAGHPGLDVFGDGRGCNMVSGRFVVDDATYDSNGNVLTFSARFEDHCEGSDIALFGVVSFNSTANYRTRAVSPTRLQLTSRGVPTSSSIHVTNNGPSTLAPATPTITGPNAGDFAVTGSTCTSPVASGASCTITVTYTPSAAQTSSATLEYSDEVAPLGSANETAGAGTGRDVPLDGTHAVCDQSAMTGISSTDQSVRLEPPDTVLAVSTNHIVEMVNTQLLAINRTDCSQTRADLNTWFGIDPISPSSAGITDPQVYFDPGSGRFFASATHVIVAGNAISGSGVRLAVSGVDDPTTWTPLRVGPDSPTQFFDQPKLGVTVGKAPNPNGWVMISWNDFTAASQHFNGAVLTAIDKSALISAVSGSTIGGTSIGPSTSLFGVVPARQSVADADAFAAYNLGGVNFMGAIRWDGAAFATAGLPITPTGLPPDALQPAGGTIIPNQCDSPCLDTGDDRVQTAVWGRNNVLWTGLNEACDPGGGVRSCLRLDQFEVTDATLRIAQDGDVGVSGWDLSYPAVEIDGSGNLVVGLTASNASTFPSTATTGQIRSGASPNFAGVRIVHQGTASYIGQRWGDYSGAAIDPANPGTVWIGDEEAMAGGPGNWTTTLAPVSLPTSNTTAPGTIAPPAFDQLGCCLALGSGPAASSWAAGRLDLFVRGADNAVLHKWFTGGWSGWESQGGVTMDNPAAVAWGPNRIDVFVRGTDDQLWHRWFDGAWHGWEPLGGVLASGPTVTTWGPGRLDVFARGANNQLLHRWYSGAWSGWESLGGTLTSGPGAVAWAPGRIDVVARDGGNGVQHTWYDGAWHPFESLGGASAGDPRISSWGPGRLDVWIQGPTDNALYHKWYGPVSAFQPVPGWSLWTDQAEALAGPPGAVSWAPERQDVFWAGADQILRHTWAG
jgi:repeat uncharacterized protein DUF346